MVAYGKEVFYGQGIFEATPGKTVVRSLHLFAVERELMQLSMVSHIK